MLFNTAPVRSCRQIYNPSNLSRVVANKQPAHFLGWLNEEQATASSVLSVYSTTHDHQGVPTHSCWMELARLANSLEVIINSSYRIMGGRGFLCSRADVGCSCNSRAPCMLRYVRPSGVRCATFLGYPASRQRIMFSSIFASESSPSVCEMPI
jgi:hypothetical protein